MYSSTSYTLRQRGTPGLGIAPAVIAAGASLLGRVRIGGRYRGGPFNPDGLQNWAAEGKWNYITQVATRGFAEHWSEPGKHGAGINYAPSDQAAARQFLIDNGRDPNTGQPVAQAAAVAPVTAAALVAQDQGVLRSGSIPSMTSFLPGAGTQPAAPAKAGFLGSIPPVALVAAAAAAFFLFKGKRR